LRRTTTVAAIAFATLACGTVPPQVASPPPYPLALGAVHVTVNRSEHQAAVVAGLRKAGIPFAESSQDLHYMLQVAVGSSKGQSGDCGKLRNVRYTLNYAILPQARVQRTEVRAPIGTTWVAETVGMGGRAIVMKARGPDGDCPSNVFNLMGAALRRQMAGDVKIIDPEDRFYDDDPRLETPRGSETLRKNWVHRSHAPDSDTYFANLRECMDESETPSREPGGVMYDRDRFEVCMKSFGWRPE